MTTSRQHTCHRDRSDDGQPGRDVGKSMVGDVRKTLRRRMTQTGVDESVDNAAGHAKHATRMSA